MDDTTTKRTVLFISVLSSFLTPFMGSAVNIALPTIGEKLSISVIMLNWVATSYILTSAICLVPFGVIADSYGRKKIFFVRHDSIHCILLAVCIIIIYLHFTSFSNTAGYRWRHDYVYWHGNTYVCFSSRRAR